MALEETYHLNSTQSGDFSTQNAEAAMVNCVRMRFVDLVSTDVASFLE